MRRNLNLSSNQASSWHISLTLPLPSSPPTPHVAVMVSAPASLVWACVSRHNSFQRSKNGRTRRSGKVIFSVEKGNVANMSTFKYSGIANDKSVDVTMGEDEKGSYPVFVKKVRDDC